MHQGYLEGAVDYLFKPLNMDILRAKVRVFADLYRKTKAVERHAEIEKQHALQQQENRILKDLLQSRDEFISIASHELKTPLSPLNLNLQAVADLIESGRINEIPRARLERLLQSSLSQVERMGRLVNDLLDASRMVEGRFPIERDWMNLSEVVCGLAHSYETEFKRHNMQLRTECEPEVLGRWDKTRLEQVVINLLSNALKYGNGKPVDVRVFSDGDEGCIIVQDRGLGIAPEDQPRIFNRFERASSTRHFGGLGLGLYIANRIVDLHHGRVTVESSLHEGSTFTVHLPKDF
jgi:signal transduction histidine kinase